MLKRIALSSLLVSALSCAAFAQQGAFPNYPIVGGAAYCSSYTNGVCTNTVPAGPSVLTGNEQFPANTELPNGQSPQNVLVTPANLNALPITWVNSITSVNPSDISASNIQGGVFYIATGTITNANLTLPLNAKDQQQFVLSSNRTITSLRISAPAGTTLGTSAQPTVLTASTAVSFGYRWVYHGATAVWQRIQ